MRILHVGKFFHPSHGGIESFLLDLARESAAQGAEQGLIVHAQKGERSGDQDLAGYPFLRHFDRVRTLGSLGYAPISPGFSLRLARALKRFRPELLYLHMPNPSAFWVLTNRQARRIPWIIHWHADASGPEFEGLVRFLYPVYRPFEQALLSRASRVIVSSQAYLDSSQALQGWHSTCRVVPLGLDPKRIDQGTAESTTQPWGQDGRLRIVAVGRLTPYKGFDVLIRALAATEAELIIVGEGKQRAQLERLIARLQLENRVHLRGAVSDTTRNLLLHSSDLICLPSKNRAEAFGVSVLEAMALGKPALVSRLEGSGLPWLVEDELTGWHVTPGDAAALAERINKLSDNRPALLAAGARAAQRYREHFDIHRVTRRIIEIQQECIASGTKRGD